MIQEDGKFQFEKDKEAVKSYFIDYINQNTVFFHDLKEKLDYLIENDYYEEEFLSKYTYEQTKSIYNIAYAKKFRFPSFMSAFKFYNDYALKTNDKKKILERYEDRVAVVALYLADGDYEKAERLVKTLINQELQPSTPTFLNAGRKRRGELVSCFLMEVNDSLNDISKAVDMSMQLSKVGGGVSLNLSKIRAKGEAIKGIENATKGVVGVMKLFDHAFRYTDQMGQRQGSGAAYLNVFHADINDFLDTKKINADEDVRVKTLSIGVVIPDKFIELAKEDKDAYVFYPYTVFKEYGIHLDDMDFNLMYDKLVDNPNVRKDKVNPRKLLEKMAILRFESGYPYIMFEDNVNAEHTLQEIGKVKFSNLCVTGDTKLLTINGYRTAKELYDEQEDLKVVIDNRTKNYENANRGTSIVKAIPMQLTARQADVYKLTTQQGFEIKATGWHKMYVLRDKKIIKIPLNEVTVEDRILVQSGEGSFGKIHAPELAYIAGLIAGDGCIDDTTAIIYLYGNKASTRSRVEKNVAFIIDKYLDRSIEYRHNASYSPVFNESTDGSRIVLTSQLLKHVLDLFYINKHTKTSIPEIVFAGDKETQAAYLSGLYQMDGTVNCNEKYKAGSIELTSTNKSSLQDIQMMLLNMGVYSTIYSYNNEGLRSMPDGKGGYKDYYCKETHKITIQDRNSRELFNSIIELKDEDKEKLTDFTKTLRPKSRNPKHNFTANVASIEYIGKEDVYDTTQEDYHSLIFNGIVTGNCSEILQFSQVSSYTDYGQDDVLGMDISCNLASINIVNVMENKSIKETVKISVDALTTVSEKTSIENAPGVQKGNNLMRSIGLGAMNLHGFLAKNKIMYESEQARDFANTFFMMVNFYSIERSMEIARDTGIKYHGYEQSSYSSGEYFNKYISDDYSPKFDKIKSLFDGIYIPTNEDWIKLKQDVMKYGLTNSYRLAIAPTGSISYVQSSTASVMPIMERIEERTYGNSKTYYPMPYLSPETWFFYKEAYDMDMFRVVDMIATIQQHIDQGISFTLFMKDTHTTRDLNRIDLYAHHKGIKTLYYARTKDTSREVCLSCSV
ncbi:Ribonucleoside-diphosphate reductase subunit alpha 2 [compost metagenome]